MTRSSLSTTARSLLFKNGQMRPADEKRELRNLIPPDVTSEFIPVRIIGKGEHGLVFEAKNRLKNNVAIKRIVYPIEDVNREEQIMQIMDSSCVIHTSAVFHAPGPTKFTRYIFFAMELMPMTLRQFLRERKPISHVYKMLFGFQIFSGLSHIHKKSIMHRDLNFDNILVDPTSGVLKIIDFGCAKFTTREASESVPYITERPYRAPEMIYGSKNYDKSVDIWAAACIYAEMIKEKPLFSGVSQIGAAQDMARILGPPGKDVIASYKGNTDIMMPARGSSSLEKELPNASKDDLELLRRCLSWDPKKRPTAEQCIEAKCFDELFTGLVLLPGHTQLPVLSRGNYSHLRNMGFK